MAGETVVLEEIIRNELRPYVRSLVERLTVELVREQLNGNGNGNGNGHTTAHVVLQARERPQDRTAPAAKGPNKVCRSCGRTAPEVRFDQNRRVCRQCRDRQQRERLLARTQAEEEHASVSVPTTFTPAS